MRKFLLKSALEKKPIEIIYQSRDGRFSKRTIVVRKVTNDYITAYCLIKQQYRTFLIDRIFAYSPVQQRKNWN